MNKLSFYLLVGLLATFISCDNKSSSDSLNVLLEEFTRSPDVPAMAAAIVRRDTFVTGVAGIKKVEEITEVRNDDKFFLASNTKFITATAIASYVNDSTVSWDLTPIKVWPELKDEILPDYHNITLEQLLSNQAELIPF